MSASPLEGDFDSGVPQRHLFFHLTCTDDILTVITTEEQIFAETVCPPMILEVFIAPFRGDQVRITVEDGLLDVVTVNNERLTFEIGRVWLKRR